MKPVVFLVVVLLVFLKNGSNCADIQTITVATYNTWNIMFNWNVRKFRIAQMVREVNPHVIAFQELRSSSATTVAHEDDYSQLSDLQSLLPNYRWKQYAMAHSVSPVLDSYITQWDREGIGILSRLPIVRHEVQNLTSHQNRDKNSRVALHIQVLLDQSYHPDTAQVVNIAVVHLSYDRQEQCSNALQIYQYIHERRHKKSVVLGDFNTYKNFESPPLIFTRRMDPQSHVMGLQCSSDIHENLVKLKAQRQILYDDAWMSVNPDKQGLTFSNMPKPGLESRPDRILYSSKELHATSAMLTGYGSTYRTHFFRQVVWNRMLAVWGAAYDSYSGRQGRSCAYDCGPHASCRCGICVSGGDTNACDLPLCQECTAWTYCTILVFLGILTLLVAQLIFGVLQVMLAMNRRGRAHGGGSSKKNCLCCNICLCDPGMFSDISSRVRSMKRRRLCRIYPVLRLPPMLLVIVSVVMIFLCGEFALHVFTDAINNIYSITPEELNPSDHLMLFADLHIKTGIAEDM